ncbi:hypothetical protein ACJ8XH_24625, partial [Klebsiella pneumoniae]
MTVFLMAVFFGLLKTGSLIALLVDAYKGWTLFWKNYDRLPHIGTVAKLAMRQPFVLFKGLTFQKLCLPGAFRPGDHHN